MNINIQSYNNLHPQLGARIYVDHQARIIGQATLGDDCSVWPFAVIRADMHAITIGNRCSIQDASVLHITHASSYNPQGYALTIGDDCTIGHQCCLHGCTLGSRILVGIGSIIMDGAIIEDDVIIGANSFIPPNKRINSGYLYLGSPAKAVRKLQQDEISRLSYMAKNYVKLKDQYLQEQQ